ncbi:MAG: D-alanyl-D-alanine carboxypeptidase [Flavobacteriaceae bacterium]
MGRFINEKHFKQKLVMILVIVLLVSCASAMKRTRKEISKTLDIPFFENQFTGFVLVDPEKKDTLYKLNAQKYFTPASNTKIFTLFTALNMLPESIPTLVYINKNDTLFIQGTGDPTTLHPYFNDTTAISFLKSQDRIALSLENFKDEKYGPGWAWDDYPYYYQPERGSFPLYGNVVTLHNEPERKVVPEYFIDSVVPIAYHSQRDAEKNTFYFSNVRKDTLEIPFRTSPSQTQKLLELVLNKKIAMATKMPEGEKTILYGANTDSVLRRMMHQSDNFLAEQLMMLAALAQSDTMNFVNTKDYMFKNHLADLKQFPKWVDGSGLSRYNLFTPESIVQVLSKMYAEIPRARLLHFFPAGGANGTLKQWYGDETPYIYAKSGSLGNTYCLSGYLLTKSGKTLIFSFMNNHFMMPNAEVKEQMQAIFEEIRERY